jgi:hypothetical protein
MAELMQQHHSCRKCGEASVWEGWEVRSRVRWQKVCDCACKVNQQQERNELREQLRDSHARAQLQLSVG